MRTIASLLAVAGLTLFSAGCKSGQAPEQAVATPPAETSAPRIYVTNEVSGDLSVIDSGNYNVLATIPLGKRPRGNPCQS